MMRDLLRVLLFVVNARITMSENIVSNEVYQLKDDEFVLRYICDGNQLDMNTTIRIASCHCDIELRRVYLNTKNIRTAGSRLNIKKEKRRNEMYIISLAELEQIKNKVIELNKKHRIHYKKERNSAFNRIMRVYENAKWCYENNFSKYENFYSFIHKK